MPYRDPIFEELDRLIAAGVDLIAKPRIPRLGAIKVDLYTFRRQAHPHTYKQHAEPWQIRRNKYLAAKGLPPETNGLLEIARKPPAQSAGQACDTRAIAAGARG